jgi:hypothetical protein
MMYSKIVCQGGIIYRCKNCKKVYRLGEWISISWALELKAKATGCQMIESDCGCTEEVQHLGLA